MKLPKDFKNLVNEIEKLPGVGSKSAMRLALHLVQDRESNANSLASALTSAKKCIRYCSVCGALSDDEICDICSDPERNQEKICVVESIVDMIAIERAAFYDGVYHVLGGVISPLEDIDDSQINLESLYSRLKNAKELIFSLPSSVESDATFLIIREEALKINPELKMTKVAIGLPIGSNIDYADSLTLIRSFENRIPGTD